MNDITAPPTAGPTSSPNPLALDGAREAAMRETWVAAGHDPAVFDQAARGDPLPEPSRPPAGPRVSVDLKTPTASEAQARGMAADLLAVGVPQDQVDAALRADGIEPAAPDTRTEDQREFDQAYSGATPDEYRIDFMGRIPTGVDATKLSGANAEATAWLSQIGFPPDIGPSVVERAFDVGQQVGRMSEPERELWVREQDYSFAKVAGSPQRVAELLKFASAALDRGDPKFRAALAKSGALNDPSVILQLAFHGERLAARPGSKN